MIVKSCGLKNTMGHHVCHPAEFVKLGILSAVPILLFASLGGFRLPVSPFDLIHLSDESSKLSAADVFPDNPTADPPAPGVVPPPTLALLPTHFV